MMSASVRPAPFALMWSLAIVLSLLGAQPSAVLAADGCRPTAGGLELLGGDDDDSGIGGTGQAPAPPSTPQRGDDDDSGIGGTGRAPGPPDEDSGIGGTGILGQVTRTSGLCVNGFSIETPASLTIETSQAMASADRMPLAGQIVFVEATSSDGRLVATRIVLVEEPGRESDASDPLGRKAFEARLRTGRELGYVSIEGRLEGGRRAPTVAGLRLEFDPGRPPEPTAQPGQLVRVGGRVREGAVLRVLPLPDWLRPARGGRPSSPDLGPAPDARQTGSDARQDTKGSPVTPTRPDTRRPPRPDRDIIRPSGRPVRPPTRPVPIDRPTQFRLDRR